MIGCSSIKYLFISSILLHYHWKNDTNYCSTLCILRLNQLSNKAENGLPGETHEPTQWRRFKSAGFTICFGNYEKFWSTGDVSYCLIPNKGELTFEINLSVTHFFYFHSAFWGQNFTTIFIGKDIAWKNYTFHYNCLASHISGFHHAISNNRSHLSAALWILDVAFSGVLIHRFPS